MNPIKTLGLAAVTALSLGVGAAMAQEGPNATVSGSTYFPGQVPAMQVQPAQPGALQSGSSDVDMRPTRQWTPGVDNHGAGSEG